VLLESLTQGVQLLHVAQEVLKLKRQHTLHLKKLFKRLLHLAVPAFHVLQDVLRLTTQEEPRLVGDIFVL